MSDDWLHNLKEGIPIISGVLVSISAVFAWGKRKMSTLARLDRTVPKLEPGEKLTTNKELDECQEKLETRIVEGLDDFFERNKNERADFRKEQNEHNRLILQRIDHVHERIDGLYKEQGK